MLAAASSLRGGRSLLILGAALAAVAVAVLIGLTSPQLGVSIAVVSAVIVLCALISTLAHIAQSGLVGAVLLLVMAVLYKIQIIQTPGISLLDLGITASSIVLVVWRLPRLHASRVGLAFVRLFLLCTGGLVLLAIVYTLFPAVVFGGSATLKELGNDLDIFVVGLGVFCYVDSLRRFAHVYALLLALSFSSLVASVVGAGSSVLSTTSLQTADAALAFALLLPFVPRRRIAALLAVASFALLVLGRVRGAWLELVAMTVVALLSPRLRSALGRGLTWTMLVASAAMIVLIALVPALAARVSTVAGGTDQSLHDRFAMAQTAVAALLSHPLTGIGPGQFKPWLLGSFPPVAQFDVGVTLIPSDPHNAFLKFAAEMGIPGLVFFAGYALSVLGPAWRFGRAALAVEELRPYAVGALLYAVWLLQYLLTAEWGTAVRLELAIGTGMLLALSRVLPDSHDVGWRRTAVSGRVRPLPAERGSPVTVHPFGMHAARRLPR